MLVHAVNRSSEAGDVYILLNSSSRVKPISEIVIEPWCDLTVPPARSQSKSSFLTKCSMRFLGPAGTIGGATQRCIQCRHGGLRRPILRGPPAAPGRRKRPQRRHRRLAPRDRPRGGRRGGRRRTAVRLSRPGQPAPGAREDEREREGPPWRMAVRPAPTRRQMGTSSRLPANERRRAVWWLCRGGDNLAGTGDSLSADRGRESIMPGRPSASLQTGRSPRVARSSKRCAAWSATG